MLFGDFADNGISDFCALAKRCEVELLHFAAAAHVVHQIKRISCATNKSHDLTLKPALSSVVYLPSTTLVNIRCSLSSKSVLKELLFNLPSFHRDLSSLFLFRFIDFSYAYFFPVPRIFCLR